MSAALQCGSSIAIPKGESSTPPAPKIGAADDTKSMIGDEYILVKKRAATFASEGIVKPPVQSDLYKANLANDLPVPSLKRNVGLWSPSPGVLLGEKGSLGGALGAPKLPVVRTWVPVATSFSATSGVAAGTLSIDPTITTESSAFDSLWSECRVLKGRYEHWPVVVSAGQYVISYDPAGSTALTSVANGCQFAQHKLYTVGFSNGGGAGSTSTLHRHDSLKFEFSVPKGIKVGSTVGGVFSAAGTSTSYGYLKVYQPNGSGTSIAINGILYLLIEYRSRS